MNGVTWAGIAWAAVGICVAAAALLLGWIDARVNCRRGEHRLAYEHGEWRCVRCPHTPTFQCRCQGCRRRAAAVTNR